MEDPVWYRIDADGTILEVGGGWADFASENEAAELAHQAVGRSLWSYVRDSVTRDIYERLLARTADRGRVDFVYRCDAPELRREFRMTMEREPGGTVRFTNRLLRTEARDRVALLEPAVERSGEVDLTACGWCKRGRHEGEWVEMEDLVTAGLFRSAPFPVVSHGICPDCEARIFGDGDAP